MDKPQIVIPQEAEQKLKEIEKKYSKKIAEQLSKIEQLLSAEMSVEMQEILDKFNLVAVEYLDHEDLDELSERYKNPEELKSTNYCSKLAKRYCNNEIIERAIRNDWSRDWDGCNRDKDIHKRFLPLYQIDKIWKYLER